MVVNGHGPATIAFTRVPRDVDEVVVVVVDSCIKTHMFTSVSRLRALMTHTK